MIALERLAQLALGELSEPEATDVEDHVLGCDGCSAILERLVELGDGIADIARDGGAGMLVGRAIVDRLERARMVTRAYHLSPGSEVACTVGAEDIYTATHLALDTRGLGRVNLVLDSASGSYRVADVPFDAGSGEVVYVLPASYLRTLPSGRRTLRLVAAEDAGDRVLGEYVLDHTAFVPG